MHQALKLWARPQEVENMITLNITAAMRLIGSFVYIGNLPELPGDLPRLSKNRSGAPKVPQSRQEPRISPRLSPEVFSTF